MGMISNLKNIKEWGLGVNADSPLIISGPCSAETEEQVVQTALELKDAGVKIFRAGIWKPRTRPNCFEGVGKKGLPWLERVKKETGMLIATEVANVKHLDEALKHNIDIIWIGARTTANPFAVQEIADRLKGKDIPVFIKNPINPDIELWIGAIERIAQAGIERIGAIHRGFSSYNSIKFRNNPQWQIPIELRQRINNIPLLCDPSHISGNKNLIQEVSQKALDLDYDGLIIESHICPKNAWSDAKQQITPKELSILTNSLIIRDLSLKDIEDKFILDELRQEIDKLDESLFELLEQRMSISEKIGKYKKEKNIKILQPERWKEILDKAISKGMSHKLSEEFTYRLFKAIHQESINKQTDIMNK